ncbi:hypothetical protein AAHA92_29313 [Salvia divinorum]|uniref:Uncharacterized protein n=1 Tax=Salvia divinorum TaxID=28513 RepID=A0ABD1G0K3_SALDI
MYIGNGIALQTLGGIHSTTVASLIAQRFRRSKCSITYFRICVSIVGFLPFRMVESRLQESRRRKRQERRNPRRFKEDLSLSCLKNWSYISSMLLLENCN